MENTHYVPMVQTYTKRVDNKEAFKYQVFRAFVDACGGDLEEFTNLVYSRFIIEDFCYSDDWKYFNVLAYFQEKVVPHKIAVFQSGIELSRNQWFEKLYIDKAQFIENLWLHDISKFSANESFGYAFHDFKSKEYSLSFEMAWHHHKQFNAHHPEHWLNANRSGILDVLPMPKIYIVEMIADWIGAGRTYGSTLEEWLPKNIQKFKWHEKTAVELKEILSNIGIETKLDGSVLYV